MGVIKVFPFVRKGLSNYINEVDNFGELPSSNNRCTVELTVNMAGSAVEDFKPGNNPSLVKTKTFALAGPGDVLSINKAAIRQAVPAKGPVKLSSGFMPYVEFYESDFPWRFTSLKDNGKILRPWLALIICKADEFKLELQSSGLPLVTIFKDACPDVLPKIKDLPYLAHAQVEFESANSSTELGSLSRLFSDRFLVKNTDYTAFLVPSFEQGRLAGTGGNPENSNIQEAAWKDDMEADLVLPVYYRWEFTTGAENFLALVKKLNPITAADYKALPDKLRVDIKDPGLADFKYEGKYIVPTDEESEEYKNFGIINVPAALQKTTKDTSVDLTEATRDMLDSQIKELKKLLSYSPVFTENAEDFGTSTIISSEEDPWVVPPVYGARHLAAGVDSLDKKSLVQTINLEYENRIAAGLGAEAVQANQEEMVNYAWSQVEEVNAINQTLRELKQAESVNKSAEPRMTRRRTLVLDKNFDLLRADAAVRKLNNSKIYRKGSIDDTMKNEQAVGQIARNADNTDIKASYTQGITSAFLKYLLDPENWKNKNVNNRTAADELINICPTVKLLKGNGDLAVSLPEYRFVKQFAYVETLEHIQDNELPYDMHKLGLVGPFNLNSSKSSSESLMMIDGKMDDTFEFLFDGLHRNDKDFLRDSLSVTADYFMKNNDASAYAENFENHIVKLPVFVEGSSGKEAYYTVILDDDRFDIAFPNEKGSSAVGLKLRLPKDNDKDADEYQVVHILRYSNLIKNKDVKLYFGTSKMPLIVNSKNKFVAGSFKDDVVIEYRYSYSRKQKNNPSFTITPSTKDNPVKATETYKVYKSIVDILSAFSQTTHTVKVCRNTDIFEDFQANGKSFSAKSSYIYGGTESYMRFPGINYNFRIVDRCVSVDKNYVTFNLDEVLRWFNSILASLEKINDNFYYPTCAYIPKSVILDAKEYDFWGMIDGDGLLKEMKSFRDSYLKIISESQMPEPYKDIPVQPEPRANEESPSFATEMGEEAINDAKNYFDDSDKFTPERIQELLDSRFPVMAYPVFPDPTSFYLRELSQKYLLPSVDKLKMNNISCFQTNSKFEEAFICGMNTEMGRELLWREYPTDQRGSYFRKFWDQEDPPTENFWTSWFDIKAVHQWKGELGSNHMTGLNCMIVFAIRGELMRAYPTTDVFLASYSNINAQYTRKYSAAMTMWLSDDIYLVGFEVTTNTALQLYLTFTEEDQSLRFNTRALEDADSTSADYALNRVNSPVVYGIPVNKIL